jgi:hypothetical protein
MSSIDGVLAASLMSSMGGFHTALGLGYLSQALCYSLKTWGMQLCSYWSGVNPAMCAMVRQWDDLVAMDEFHS